MDPVITIEDIKKAISGGGDVSPFISALRRALGDPPVTIMPSLELPAVLPEATVLLKSLDGGLASLLDEWLAGKVYQASLTPDNELTVVGLAPFGKNTANSLERIIEEIRPDIVAVDISPVKLSANMLYAFSLPCAVGLPVYGSMSTIDDKRPYSAEPFYPGNTVQTAILKCWLARIPLIPVGMPLVPGRSQHGMAGADYLDKQIARSNLLAAYHVLDESLERMLRLQEGTKVTPQVGEICSRLSNALRAGLSDKIVEEASYIASRIIDVGSLMGRLSKRIRLLVIVDLKHYQDTQYFIDLLKRGITEEVYLPPCYDVPAATLTMECQHSAKLDEYAQHSTPKTSLVQGLFSRELEKLSTAKGNEPISENEIDNLISAVVSRTREHPDVARGASVRGSIAFREVLQGFQEIQNGLTKGSFAKAALVTLPPRISTRPGKSESASDIVSDIVKEVLYGFRFSLPKAETRLPDKTDWLSPEDILTALQNLAPTQLSPEQKAQLARKGRVVIVPDEDGGQGLSESLASKDWLQGASEKRYPFSKKALEHLIEELEQKLRRGEITESEYQREKSKLDEMLRAASQLSSRMSGKELAETVTELMDAKDKQWRKELSFQDMYVYYHIKGTCEGKQLSPPKRGWYGLRVVIDYLEKRGILRTEAAGRSFTLTAEALDALLEHLVSKAQQGGERDSLIGYGKAPLSERKHDVRRYAIGDVFRDISIRHTLKEIARQKKHLSDIDRRDFKVFMRQRRRLQSDIILCLDSSGSMGFRQKLIYARLVAAGLARAALENGDRVGLVTFDDLGRAVLPLTSSREAIFDYIVNINAGGNTNIGDGITCATELLFHGPSRNQKYIVLITDGQPSAISQKAFDQLNPAKERDLSEECAIFETRKASSSGVRISVVHITDDQEAGRELVKSIARAGKGQVRTISSVEDIRLMAR